MRCPNPDCPDLTRFGVQGRYQEGITHCAKCGAVLIPDTTPNGEAHDPTLPDSSTGAPLFEGVDESDTLVSIMSFDYRNQADLLASALIGNGVPAEVICDDCGAQSPALSLTNEAFIQVRSADLEQADDLLDAVLDESQEFPEALEPDPTDDIDAATLALLQHTWRWAQRFVAVGILGFSWVLFPTALFFALYGLSVVQRETSSVAAIYQRRFIALALLSGLHTVAAVPLIFIAVAYAIGVPM